MDESIKAAFLILFLFSVRIANGDEGYFWHVTDMHWDYTYNANTAALSCNSEDPGGNYGKYGNYLCDSPWPLINSSVYAMKAIKNDVDFMIWTGDDTPHIYNDTILNQEVVWNIITNLTDKLVEVFPDMQFYSALGNHDWSPKHQLPPCPDPFYARIADYWSRWLTDPTAKADFEKGAFYTMPIPGTKIKVVILNTNLYYTNNKLTPTLEDPAEQFEWLDSVCKNASAANEKIMIIGHVPPGVFEKHRDKHWFYPNFNVRFTELLREHSASIGSIHMAHHHTDSFRIIYGSSGEPVVSILLGPAVTPWETTLPDVMGGAGNNPSIRLIKYDKATAQVLDIFQYWLNLTEANLGNVEWELLYQATEYYNLPNAGKDSLNSLAQSFLTDDALFDKYYQANGVNFDPNERWTNEYRTAHYCAITELNYERHDTCFKKHTAGCTTLFSSMILLCLSIVAGFFL